MFTTPNQIRTGSKYLETKKEQARRVQQSIDAHAEPGNKKRELEVETQMWRDFEVEKKMRDLEAENKMLRELLSEKIVLRDLEVVDEPDLEDDSRQPGSHLKPKTKVVKCPHKDRPIRAKGMCSLCYYRHWSKIKISSSIASLKSEQREKNKVVFNESQNFFEKMAQSWAISEPQKNLSKPEPNIERFLNLCFPKTKKPEPEIKPTLGLKLWEQKAEAKQQELERRLFKDLYDFPVLTSFQRLESRSKETFDRLQLLPHVKMRNSLEPFIFQPMEAYKNCKLIQYKGKDHYYIGYADGQNKSGNGILIMAKDKVYEGSFSNGQISGFGRLVNLNSEGKQPFWYKGYFKHGEFSQTGHLSWCDGEYEGGFSNNMFQGQGVLRLNNGEQLSGVWTKNYLNGQGKIVYPNGDVYEGKITHGQCNGYGKYTSNLIPPKVFQGVWEFGNRLSGIEESPKKEDMQ